VISILAAGFEVPIDPKDLECQNHYNFIKASLSAATMTDLMFEELAKTHPTVSFVHAYPGSVGTHLVDHMLDSTPGLLWYPAQIPRYTILPVYTHLFATAPEIVGEKILFLATSCRYPPASDHEVTGHVGGLVERPAGVTAARSTVAKDGKGNGVYRTTWNCEVCKESKILEKHREERLGMVVFEHTMDVFERVLGEGIGSGK